MDLRKRSRLRDFLDDPCPEWTGLKIPDRNHHHGQKREIRKRSDPDRPRSVTRLNCLRSLCRNRMIGEEAMTEKPGNKSCADQHWELLSAVRRSVRYHHRRESWPDDAHGFGALLTTIPGSATFVSVLAGFNPLFVTAAAVTAVVSAVGLIFGLAGKARLHSECAHEFIGLARDLVRSGEELSEAELRVFTTRRPDMEAKEPPMLRVPDALCHDELVTAPDIPGAERTDPNWFQRCLANFRDVRAHRLHRNASRQQSWTFVSHWAAIRRSLA